MLEAAIVAVLGFVIWVAIQGWFGGMPTSRGMNLNITKDPLKIRFGLRALLISVTALSVVLGLAIWVWRGLADAHPAAVRNEYLGGRITLEEARQDIGDIVDTWPPSIHERVRDNDERRQKTGNSN